MVRCERGQSNSTFQTCQDMCSDSAESTQNVANPYRAIRLRMSFHKHAPEPTSPWCTGRGLCIATGKPCLNRQSIPGISASAPMHCQNCPTQRNNLQSHRVRLAKNGKLQHVLRRETSYWAVCKKRTESAFQPLVGCTESTPANLQTMQNFYSRLTCLVFMDCTKNRSSACLPV